MENETTPTINMKEFTKREGPFPTTILGLREDIYTNSGSSMTN